MTTLRPTDESYSVPALLRAIEDFADKYPHLLLPTDDRDWDTTPRQWILTRAAELTASNASNRQHEGDVRSTVQGWEIEMSDDSPYPPIIRLRRPDGVAMVMTKGDFCYPYFAAIAKPEPPHED